MGYELIALDIDGTIRSNERPISARTRRAVERVTQQGAVVTLATGRMFQSALAPAAELSITCPIISYQGARIADPTTGKVMWHRPLTPAMALASLSALDTWEGEVLAYQGDEVYVEKLTPWVEGYRQRTQRPVRIVADLRELAPARLTRLVAVGGEEDIYELSLRLKTSFDARIHVTRSLPYFCEILHPQGGKHRALAWLCRHLGVRREKTVAFGNGYDDDRMLRWAGLGVAVSGAVPELLEAADRIAPPMEEDGVAHVLEDLLQRGLVG